MDHRPTRGSIITRRRLLAGAAVLSAPAGVAVAARVLMARADQAADHPPLPVGPPRTPGPLKRLAPTVPLRLGSPVDAALADATPGSTITGNPPGLRIDGAARTIRGTPETRAWLVTETLGEHGRDTLMTALSGAPRTMKLGMNMAGIAFYGQNNVFLDHMKCAEVGTAAATSDVNGMPLTLKADPFGNVHCSWIVPMPDGRTNPVRFRVITDGEFDCDVQTQGVGPPRRAVKQGGDYVFTYRDGPTGPDKNYMYLRISRLRRPPTRLAVVREDEVELFRAGRKIRPLCAQALKGFAWLRMMNWARANAADPPTVTDDSLLFNNGVPLSYQVALCKELGIAGWFNIHVKATDADVRALWPAFDELRAAGLDVYLELSNEVWNGQFPQYAFANQRGMERGFGSENTYMAGIKWTGFRTAQLAMQSRGRGYRWVVGCQPSDQGYQEHFVLEGIAAVPGAAKTDIWGWTSTAYSSGTLTNAPANLPAGQDERQRGWVTTLNFDAAFDNIINSGGDPCYSIARNRRFLDTSKAIADRNGWKLVLYECGTLHLNRLPGLADRPGYEALFYGMANHPLVKVTTAISMEVSQEAGVYGATWFDFDSEPANSDYGVFGVFGRPSYDALREWVDASRT